MGQKEDWGRRGGGWGVVTVARHSLQSGCGVCNPPGGESRVQDGPEPGIPTLPGDAGLSADHPPPCPHKPQHLFCGVSQQRGTMRVFCGSSFSEIWFASISSQPGGRLYILLAVSLGAQSLGQSCWSIFAFAARAFGVFGEGIQLEGSLGGSLVCLQIWHK